MDSVFLIMGQIGAKPIIVYIGPAAILAHLPDLFIKICRFIPAWRPLFCLRRHIDDGTYENLGIRIILEQGIDLCFIYFSI